MSKITLEERIINILESLSEHLVEAPELIEAVKNGLEEDVLLELAELLSRAANSAESEVRSEAIDKIRSVVREHRQEEERERTIESTKAHDAITVDFP